MKPIRLEIEGINSYSDKASIDFEFLTSRGIFGIFGRTGSGKSTILDAITLALYGNISRGTKEYINSNSKKAFIEYEFELLESSKRQRYKIARRFKRKNGVGNSSVSDYVRFMKQNKVGEFEIIADKVGDANDKVKNLLGLEEGDFLKSVVLPQGKFGEFLSLGGKDRRNMLERIFNLSEYGSELSKKIAVEKRGIEDEKNRIDAKMAEYPDINTDELEKLEAERDSLREEEKRIYSEVKKLENTYEDVKKIYELSLEKKLKNERLIELEKNDEQVSRLKISLELSTRLEKYLTDMDRSRENFKNISKFKEKIFDDEKKLRDVGKVKKSSKEELEKLLSKFSNIEEEKIKNTVDYEFRKGIEEGFYLTKQLKRLDFDLDEKNEIVKKQVIEKESVRKDIVVIKDELSFLNESLKKIEINIGEKEETKVLTEDELEKKIERVRKIENRLEDFKRKFNEKSDLFEKSKKLISEIKSKKNEVEDIKIKVEKERKRQISLNQEFDLIIKKMADELRTLWIKNHSIDKNSHESCPLCGCEVELEKLYKYKEEIKIDEESSDPLKDLDELNDNIISLEKLIVEKEANIEYLDRNLKDNEELIKNIESEYREEEYNNLLDEKNSLAKKYELEKEKIREKFEYISRLKEEKQSLEKKILDKEKSLALNNMEEESIDRNLEEVKSQIEKIRLESKNVLSGINTINMRLKIQDVSKEKVNIEKKDRILSEIDEEIRCLREKIDSLKNKIDDKNHQENLIKIELTSLKTSLDSAKTSLKTDIEALLKNLTQVFDNLIQESSISLDARREILLEYIKKRENIGYLLARMNGDTSDTRTGEFFKYDTKDIIHQNGGMDELEKATNLIESILSEGILDGDVFYEFEKKVDAHIEMKNEVLLRLRILEESLSDRSASSEDVAEKKEELEYVTEKYEKIKTEIVKTNYKIVEMKKNIDILKDLSSRLEEVEKKLFDVVDLEKVMRGNKFVEYLSQLHLKNIVFDASDRLSKITGGRYSLDINSDYMFIVVDNFNGGMTRSADTLSGGETFLTSLSLALSLSSQIQLKGSVPLEFFFLDEGFGTLDEDLLDTVMESLEKLQGENMSIGVISHVEELKNRIPMKLLVDLDKESSSSTVTIQQG